jgi:type IV pilus assembly protein PilO
MNIKDVQVKFHAFLDEKVSVLDQNIKLAIMAAAVIVPLVGFYIGSYKPQNDQMKLLEGQKVGLLQTIRRVEGIASNIGKHRVDMAEAKLMFQKASNLLPQQQEIPALLTNISDLCSNSGLEILSFRPGSEVAKTFYAEIPLTINVQGAYHNVGVFLDKVSKMSRIVSVSSMGLSGPREDEGEMILTTNLQLETYRFVEKLPGQ